MHEFERTGFRGGLNGYRTIDRNWELTSSLNGAKLCQPALFVAGEFDPVIAMNREIFNTMGKNMWDLKKKVLLAGAGHWIQRERPTEVNQLLIEFLTSLTIF